MEHYGLLYHWNPDSRNKSTEELDVVLKDGTVDMSERAGEILWTT